MTASPRLPRFRHAAIAATVLVVAALFAIRAHRGRPAAPLVASEATQGPSAMRAPRIRTAPSAPSKPAADAPRPAAEPWWSSIPAEERTARLQDFEYMRSLPGSFPEFNLLVHELVEAGVAREAVEMEAREVLGALLERRMFERLRDEDLLPVGDDPLGLLRSNREMMAEHFESKRKVAADEAVERLASLGIAADSEAGERILQLRPTSPLVPLAAATPPPVAATSAPPIPPGHARRSVDEARELFERLVRKAYPQDFPPGVQFQP